MPPYFCATYIPVSDAGTQNQIKHVAHLLATQMTNAGIGPGAEQFGYASIKVTEHNAIFIMNIN